MRNFHRHPLAEKDLYLPFFCFVGLLSVQFCAIVSHESAFVKPLFEKTGAVHKNFMRFSVVHAKSTKNVPFGADMTGYRATPYSVLGSVTDRVSVF